MDDIDRANRRETEMSLVRREMERKSKDLIRVYNPTDFPFRFTWDSYPQIVPSKGYKDMERYLAEVYFRKMSQKLIGEDQLLKGKELLDKRMADFGTGFPDRYIENKEVWDRVPRIDDEKLLDEYSKILIIGLVEEYGIEDVPDREREIEKKETPYDEAYKRMDRKILEPMEDMA